MPFAVYNALRAISLFLCLFRVISVLAIPTENAHSFYTTPHSLGHSYTFEARDGWTSVNISNRLSYTHPPDSQKHLEARSKHSKEHTKEHTSKNNQGKKSKTKTKTKTHNTKGKANLQAAAVNVTGAISKLGEELKGIGQPQGVTITWYDGQDLKNPSCWSSDVWTPTDAAFVCALTLQGWLNKPQCFKFIELCNGPHTCIFVRVVDTCAGCAPDSKHVDLTKSAFKSLADLDVGTLTVQMRLATDPGTWLENLWGPKA